MTFLKEEICTGCQMKIELYDIQQVIGPNKGEWIRWKKGCKCEDIALANEAIRLKEQAKIKKLQSKFDAHSLISNDLKNANFDNYEPENRGQEYAKRTSQKYVEIFNIDEPRNLLFHGSFGLGKSHLAKSIADGLLERGFSTLFISVPKLLRKFRATYSKDSDISEDEVTEMLESVNCLILDDLGAEKKSDWTAERLFDVIDSRQGKHTIYTTNYEPEDLIHKLGERNFSRVINRDTTVIEIDGENHRLKDFMGGN